MYISTPEPGLLISYAYFWRHEREAGLEEGRKNRPCVIILAAEKYDDRTVVTVAPISHSVPTGDATGLEIPPRVKQHLGLDDEKSWVILSEVNQFTWPGYDLRPVPGDEDRNEYGFLPPKLFEKIKSGVLDLIVKRRSGVIRRDWP